MHQVHSSGAHEKNIIWWLHVRVYLKELNELTALFCGFVDVSFCWFVNFFDGYLMLYAQFTIMITFAPADETCVQEIKLC